MARRQARTFGVERASLYLAAGLAASVSLACGSDVMAPGDSGPGSGGQGQVPGGSGGSVGSGGHAPASCEAATVDTDATVLRRLSALEYRLTTQDLLQLPEPPSADDVPLDNERLGFRTFAEYQTMSADNLRAYLDKAASLASDLFADAARRDAVLGCETSAPTCLPEFVARFGKLAYRRPLAAEEVSSIVSAAEEFGLDADDQFAFAIEAFLSSSQFLYRIEVGSEPEGLSELTQNELAAKLSFALWGRGPSAEQLDAAAAGALDTPEGLASAAQSMLTDERAQTFFEQFFRQWLGYQTLKPPNAEATQAFADMQVETDRLLEEFAWGAGNVLGALTANHTYVTPTLAEYYGLPAPDAEGRLEFAPGNPRENSGLLTHAALLSAKSDGDLIAIRGNWLLRTFLCEEIEIPASLADTIGELLVGLDRVGIVEARNTRTECVNCHAIIDPIGIGFGSFDRAGVFDEAEDPSIFGIPAALPPAPAPNTFSNVAGLATQLAAMPEVPACLTERAYLYVNGRPPTRVDECAVEGITTGFETEGHTFPGLLEAVVTSPAFRLRRAPEPTP